MTQRQFLSIRYPSRRVQIKLIVVVSTQRSTTEHLTRAQAAAATADCPKDSWCRRRPIVAHDSRGFIAPNDTSTQRLRFCSSSVIATRLSPFPFASACIVANTTIRAKDVDRSSETLLCLDSYRTMLNALGSQSDSDDGRASIVFWLETRTLLATGRFKRDSCPRV